VSNIAAMQPGSELSLVNRHGTLLGLAKVQSVSQEGDVIASIELSGVQPPPRELELLLELLEATDCMAFAAMEQLEVELARIGLFLEHGSTTLQLRGDFSGLVLTEAGKRIAFRLRAGPQ
jgi:hypothetical protein